MRRAAVLALALALAVALGLGPARGWFLLNLTGSVPVGLYAAAEPGEASFVAFCLPELPAGIRHAPGLCTGSRPGGTPVLKRIAARAPDGVLVRGDARASLDSRVFGRVPERLVRGHYRPLLTLGFAGARRR